MMKEKIRTEMALQQEQPVEEEKPVEVVEEEQPVEQEPVVEEKEEEAPAPEVKKPAKRTKADLEKMAEKNEYVSEFEKLADTSKPKQQDKPKRKKRKADDEDIKVRNKVLEQQLRKDLETSNVKPIYTEEELEEIERQQMEEEESQYDIDYDEYEEYYDEDND